MGSVMDAWDDFPVKYLGVRCIVKSRYWYLIPNLDLIISILQYTMIEYLRLGVDKFILTIFTKTYWLWGLQP